MSPVIGGCDVGGSRSRIAIEVDGMLRHRSEGPGAGLRLDSVEHSTHSIAGTVREALLAARVPRLDRLVVGAAGAGTPEVRDAARRLLEGEGFAETVEVTTDLEIALAAAFGLDGIGVLILAGTGSAVIGRLPDGTIRRLGGYGWRMGDDGSAYALGLAGLKAVASAQDGIGPTTALTARFLDRYGPDFRDLVAWSVAATPGEIASLAPDVVSTADSDPVAARIVDQAAEGLARQAAPLLTAFPQGIPPVAAAGGVLRRAGSVRSSLLHALERRGIELDELPVADPVLGALTLARDRPTGRS